MEKLKVRVVVGWRERESQLRRKKTRVRASEGAFRSALNASEQKKKVEPLA